MTVNGLSFDPRHPWFAVPGLPGAQWSVEVFTVEDVRLPDPAVATFDGRVLDSAGMVWPGRQRTAPGRLRVEVTEDDGVLSWRIVAEADLPIKAVKVLYHGLPGEGEGWWSPTTARGEELRPTPDEPVKLRYPWSTWQTPWVCRGDGPAVALSVRDREVGAKRFYTWLPPWADGSIAEVVCDQLATRRATRFEVPEVRLAVCGDRAATLADLEGHLAHLEAAFGLTRWSDRADAPPWASDVRLVVTLHGQHWTGFVFNTFDDMCAILRRVTAHLPGRQVLAYLPGWEGRYYWQYPHYEPAEDLGGPEGFGRLVATARELGVHLMPMFGANGANVRRYPGWEQSAFRSPSDRLVVNVNHPDWDGDRTSEDDQVFLNPGEPGYREFLRDQISRLAGAYDVPGVFLDTSACWFDDPHHDLYQGYRQLVAELREAHPDLLICGEGWYDALLGLFPMNQTWLDVSRPAKVAGLPGRYSRLLGHLSSGCPGDGSTGVHEGGYRAPAKPLAIDGFVPSLGFVAHTMDRYGDEVDAFCREIAENA